jgi:hypothetical protein
MRTNIPLVLVVRFFVSPPKGVSVAAKELRLESVPAVMCYELCDYTLSFLEMLHHVLFNSYRQVVKLDVIKVYSSNPRTTVKMMKWDEYVKLQGHDTIHPKAKSKHKDVARQGIQPKRARHEANSNARPQEAQGNAIAEGSSACDSALRASCPAQPHGKKTRAAKQKTTHKAP